MPIYKAIEDPNAERVREGLEGLEGEMIGERPQTPRVFPNPWGLYIADTAFCSLDSNEDVTGALKGFAEQ